MLWPYFSYGFILVWNCVRRRLQRSQSEILRLKLNNLKRKIQNKNLFPRYFFLKLKGFWWSMVLNRIFFTCQCFLPVWCAKFKVRFKNPVYKYYIVDIIIAVSNNKVNGFLNLFNSYDQYLKFSVENEINSLVNNSISLFGYFIKNKFW